MADAFSFGYAAVVTIGGIVGYLKAGSTMSLASGLLFGALSFYGAYQTSQDPKNFYISLGTSAILAVVMGVRFSNSGKFMPAGLVCVLSSLQAGRFLLSLVM